MTGTFGIFIETDNENSKNAFDTVIDYFMKYYDVV